MEKEPGFSPKEIMAEIDKNWAKPDEKMKKTNEMLFSWISEIKNKKDKSKDIKLTEEEKQSVKDLEFLIDNCEKKDVDDKIFLLQGLLKEHPELKFAMQIKITSSIKAIISEIKKETNISLEKAKKLSNKLWTLKEIKKQFNF